MSNSGRLHQHKCPRCGITSKCGDSQCYRTNYNETRLCHGSRCAQDTPKKPPPRPKPPEEPSLFQRDPPTASE